MRQRSTTAAIASWDGKYRSVLALLLTLLVSASDRPARAHHDHWLPVGAELAAPAESAPLSRIETVQVLGDLLLVRPLAGPADGALNAADAAALLPAANAASTTPPPAQHAVLRLNRRGVDSTGPPAASG